MPKNMRDMERGRDVPDGHVSLTLTLPRDLVHQVDAARIECQRECEQGKKPPRGEIIAQALTAWFAQEEEVSYVPVQ